jgi:hypothetical protein
MSATMNSYSLHYINKVKQQGFDYELPESTMYLINKITKLVGGASYSRTPIFKKRMGNDPFKNNALANVVIDRNHMGTAITNKKDDDGFTQVHGRNRRNKKNKAREVTDDEWEMLRNFETTKIQKNEEGIEKELNKIRIQLNKLTDSTFTDVKMEIYMIINEFIADVSEEDMLKVSNMIFDVGSSNAFYGKQYALLYKELMEKYPIMVGVFEKQMSQIVEQISNVRNADADKDYEEFCSVNAENSKKQSLAKFICHMYNEEMVDTPKIFTLLNDVFEIFTKNVVEDDVSYVCEYAVETLFEMIKTAGEKLVQKSDSFAELKDNIEIWGGKSTKSLSSFTNKSKFKLMDALEYIEDELE